jgi:hypothetical protein
MPAPLMTTADLFGLASLAPADLAAVAAAAAGRDVRELTHTRARAVPVDYEWGSPATAGLWRVQVRADAPGSPVDQVFFVKLLRHTRLWPLLGQLPDEAAREDFVTYFPWRFELDMLECGIAGILPPGMRAPALYWAQQADADHIALWSEWVEQRPGPWGLADFRRAARLLGRLAARRREGAPANQRLPELAGFQRPGEALRYYVAGRVMRGAVPALEAEATWHHPVLAAALRGVADPGLPADLTRLAARLPALLDRLDGLPQCYAHGDASPQNLLIPAAAPDELVVIDWGFGCPLPVGFDLGQLLVGLASAGVPGLPDLAQIDPVITDGYLDGLRAEGHDADPADVRTGYLGGLAARSALCLLPLELLGHPQPAGELEALLRQRLRLTRMVLDLTSELWSSR